MPKELAKLSGKAEPPFRFNLTSLVKKARRGFANRTDGVCVSLNLPFISITATPADLERQTARDIVIRLADRRVLSGKECCDNCIDQSLESLQSIRSILVDKQVQLSNLTDGPLYFLLEAMLVGIRQFVTYEERLSGSGGDWDKDGHPDFRRPMDQRESYFAALELLRGHLSRCLGQVSVIADIELPTVGAIASCKDAWPLENYVDPSRRLS